MARASHRRPRCAESLLWAFAAERALNAAFSPGSASDRDHTPQPDMRNVARLCFTRISRAAQVRFNCFANAVLTR